MTSALVTGGYGFVGRHVARALAQRGVDVVAIGHGSWGRGEWKDWGIARWHQADVSLNALRTYGGEPDAIYHCAGSGSVGFSMHHPSQDFERNVITTLATLEYMRNECPKAALVLASSAGVYGLVKEIPTTTACSLHPVSPYGLHKKIAEDICRSYGEHFGLRCAIVRLFSIFGIGLRKQLLWDACNKLTKGNATFSGTGDEMRDWIHINDAAELLVCATEHASRKCIVTNGGSGLATTVRDVIVLLADELGVADKITYSGHMRPGDPVHYQADLTEAINWGWHTEQNFEQEVRNYARWFAEGAP